MWSLFAPLSALIAVAVAQSSVEQVIVLRDLCHRNFVGWQLRRTDVTVPVSYRNYSSCDDTQIQQDDALATAFEDVYNANNSTLILQSQVVITTNTPQSNINDALSALQGDWDAIGAIDCSPDPTQTVEDASTTLIDADHVCINGFLLSPSGAAKLLGIAPSPTSPATDDVPSATPDATSSDVPSATQSDVPSDIPDVTSSDVPSATQSETPSQTSSDVASETSSDVPSATPSQNDKRFRALDADGFTLYDLNPYIGRVRG